MTELSGNNCYKLWMILIVIMQIPYMINII